MARFGFSGLKTVKTYFCHYGQQRSNGKYFPKSYCAQHAHENQQFIKIPCKQQRILSVEEFHQVLLQTFFPRHVTMCFQSHHASTTTPDRNSLSSGSPPSHLGCISHSSTRTPKMLPDHCPNPPRVWTILLRQPFQVKLKKGKTTI